MDAARARSRCERGPRTGGWGSTSGEIEATTVAKDLTVAGAAALSLICDLTGLPPDAVVCEITLGRPT